MPSTANLEPGGSDSTQSYWFLCLCLRVSSDHPGSMKSLDAMGTVEVRFLLLAGKMGVRWNDQHVGRLLSPSAAPPASPALCAAGCQKELENLAMVHLLPQLCLQNVLSGLFQVSLSGSWQVPGINVPFTLLNSLQNFHDHHRHGQGILPRARHLSWWYPASSARFTPIASGKREPTGIFKEALSTGESKRKYPLWAFSHTHQRKQQFQSSFASYRH